MKHTARFTLDRETPGTVRYAELDDDGVVIGPGAVIRTIDINRSALPRPFPQSITVTVEA